MDPFFQLDALIQSKQLSDCMTLCQSGGPNNVCGARIQPDCLRIAEDGIVRISLSVPARAWFDMLPQLGETLCLTRNPMAVQGRLGHMRPIDDWRNAILPRDPCGLDAPNLAEHGSVWAVRELLAGTVAHGFEVRDVSGVSFQKIMLTADSRRDVFEEFVTLHQSPPEQAARWAAPNHRSSLDRHTNIAGRIPLLRSRLNSGSPNVRQMSAEFVLQVMAACADAGISIRTSLYSRPIIQSTIWKPGRHELKSSSEAPVQFFHGDDVGMHLDMQAIGSVWLWMGHCHCCAAQRWSIELGGHNETLSLAFQAGDHDVELRWRELICDLL